MTSPSPNNGWLSANCEWISTDMLARDGTSLRDRSNEGDTHCDYGSMRHVSHRRTKFGSLANTSRPGRGLVTEFFEAAATARCAIRDSTWIRSRFATLALGRGQIRVRRSRLIHFPFVDYGAIEPPRIARSNRGDPSRAQQPVDSRRMDPQMLREFRHGQRPNG
jgi:hypothetical protein